MNKDDIQQIKLVEVIEIKFSTYDSASEKQFLVTQYYTKDGILLAERQKPA